MSALVARTEPDALVATAHAVLERHGRSFALAGRLLPPAARDDAAILYAFCREVDDTADEAPSRSVAMAGLDAIEAELSGRAAPRPLVQAYLTVCARHGIPAEAGAELLRGVRGDLDPVVVADDDELLRYGYRVAGTVGLMMCGVLGVRDRAAWSQAIDLGIAMQITNICRDVAEDAGRGRVYLPATRLRGHGVDAQALLQPDAADRVEVRRATARTVLDLLDLADTYYASATSGMAAIPLRARLAIGAAARIYRQIGVRLRDRHRADAWHGRTVVPTAGRVLALFAGVWTAATAGLRRRAHDARLHVALRGLPGVAVRPVAQTDAAEKLLEAPCAIS